MIAVLSRDALIRFPLVPQYLTELLAGIGAELGTAVYDDIGIAR